MVALKEKKAFLHLICAAVHALS